MTTNCPCPRQSPTLQLGDLTMCQTCGLFRHTQSNTDDYKRGVEENYPTIYLDIAVEGDDQHLWVPFFIKNEKIQLFLDGGVPQELVWRICEADNPKNVLFSKPFYEFDEVLREIGLLE